MGASRLFLIILAGAALGALLYGFDLVGTGEDPTDTTTVAGASTTAPPPPTPTTIARPPCDPPTVAEPPELTGSLTEQSLQLSSQAFTCADAVIVARPGAIERSAALAAAELSPLLIYTPGSLDPILDEIARLDPISVLVTSPTIDLGGNVATETVDPVAPTPDAGGSTVWFVGETDAEPSLLELAAAFAGAGVVSGESLSSISDDARSTIRSADDVIPVGAVDPEFEWRIDVLRSGLTNPGGGIDLIDNTRFVAFYGNPTTSALGVLGEQGPVAGLERLAPIVAEYEADGAIGVPTFEIIVTVADAVPGDDGDYSAEMSPDVVRPWIEAAADAGAYVLLDLQPGRTDFLTQAMIYEEFLRLPHVGLALDPEWRLEPDQFHLRQIGSVDAAEVNLVSEWLAGIVREEALPQKMFLLHQFRLDMLTNRPEIELRPELATVIQMDGQGPIGTKYETYAALTNPADADRFEWGWKNFYDEDTPTPTPSQVLELDPLPVYVSYQ